jgi:hypothetical protein
MAMPYWCEDFSKITYSQAESSCNLNLSSSGWYLVPGTLQHLKKLLSLLFKPPT